MGKACSCAESAPCLPAEVAARSQSVRIPVFRPAQAEDFEGIQALLRESDLLADDLGGQMLAHFQVADDEQGKIACCVGLELKGAAALLRSLVVKPAWRGSGIGQAAVASIEQQARGRGVSTLYLLTKTAVEFFALLGYQRCERSAVPEAVRETAQFAGLCPASAACLHKVLV